MDKNQNNTNRSSIFSKLSEKIFSLLKSGMFGYFFTSYDDANDRYQRAIKRKRAVHSNKARRTISKTIERSFFVNIIPRFIEFLLRTSTRDYGITMLLMGAVTTILYPLREQILFIEISRSTFFAGIVICLCSIPLIISSKSLATNLYTSKICNAFMFDLLGFDKERMREISEKNRHSSTNIAFFIGLALGIASYFVLPGRLVLFAVILVLAYSVLRTPEIGVVAVIFAIPFFSVKILCIATAYVFICYVIKCTIGKRTFKFEYLDLFVVLTMLAMLIRSFFTSEMKASVTEALISICLTLSYFLVTNLVKSKEWFRRCIISLVISGTAVVIVAILQIIIGRISVFVPDLSQVFAYGQSASSTFGDPMVLSQYLVALIPFAMIRMMSERNKSSKFLGFLFCIFLIVTVCLTNSLPALIGIITASLLLLIIYHRNYSYLALILLVATPILYVSLPDDIMARMAALEMFDSFSITNIIEEIRHAFQIFLQNPLGLGMSSSALASELGADNPHIDNLFLQVLLEQGVVVMLVIIFLVVMISRMTFSYCAKAKNKYRRINCGASLCSVVGLLTSGLFAFAFYDQRLYLLVFVLVGISFAYTRMEREEEPKAKAHDFTSATLDITLTGEGGHDNVPKRKYVRMPRLRRQDNEENEIKDFEQDEAEPYIPEFNPEQEQNQENEETKF